MRKKKKKERANNVKEVTKSEISNGSERPNTY